MNTMYTWQNSKSNRMLQCYTLFVLKTLCSKPVTCPKVYFSLAAALWPVSVGGGKIKKPSSLWAPPSKRSSHRADREFCLIFTEPARKDRAFEQGELFRGEQTVNSAAEEVIIAKPPAATDSLFV